MEGIGINLPILLAQVINFVILLVLLYLVAYKPLMRMLDERSQRVKESMEQAEQICDSILMIHNGRKVLDGTLAEVRSSGSQGVLLDYDGDGTVLQTLPGVSRVNDSGKQAELILGQDADPQEILRTLVGKITIRRFDLREPSLHEIFVRTVGGNPE